MSAVGLIGREVSLPLPGSRRRERGYVADLEDGQLLICLYPERGWEFAERLVTAEAARILKAQAPAGWQAVDVLNQDGTLAFSLRLPAETFQAIGRLAAERSLDFEQMFNELLRIGLDRAELAPDEHAGQAAG